MSSLIFEVSLRFNGPVNAISVIFGCIGYKQYSSLKVKIAAAQLCTVDNIIELFALCKGGNFNIHIWAWFCYFIC